MSEETELVVRSEFVDEGSDFVIVDLDNANPIASNAQMTNIAIEQNQSIREPILVKSIPESIDTKLKDIKSKHFQICVKVIECKRLQGINVDPFVTVQVDERKKHTAVKKSTNAPYYDEYFTFNFYQQQKRLFDKLITFTCSHSKNLLQSDDVIGIFQLDIGTVYEQANHQFLGKWIPLLHPTSGESSGYIKCDITVQTKEEIGSRNSSRSSSEEREIVQQTESRTEEQIENNLLLPSGVTDRQLVKLVVKVFQADCLPRCDSGVGAALKKAFTAGTKDIINPYVVVSFAGLQGKTSVAKKTCYPKWNQQIAFTYLFPPLFQHIKIQVFDAATGSDDIIATYYLPIKKISNNDSDGEGYLPTFGPSYVHLYGAPRDSCDDDYEDLNDGLQEGVAFRGRLLIGITTKFIEAPETEKDVTVENISPLSEKHFGEEEEYLLYACIHDSDMLSPKYADKPISYEISIGDPDDIDGDGQITDADKKALKDYKGISPAVKPSKCFSNRQKDYFYLPINNEKLSIYSKSRWFNNRKRLFDSNVISMIIRQLELGIADIEALFEADHPDVGKRFSGVLDVMIENCNLFLIRLSKTEENKLKSKLAIEKIKEHTDLFERIIRNAQKVKKSILNTLDDESFEVLYEILEKLREIENNIEETYPDIFLTLLAGGKRVAFARLSVRDFMFSKDVNERGVYCGVGRYIFIYSPFKNVMKLRNRVRIYVWFGLNEHKAHCLDGMPKGYRIDNNISKLASLQTPPPSSIIYDEKHQFELRAHLFQARSLIASDATGLSDPYAKIYFLNSCLISQVINQTLSPTWDEMLVSTSLTLYGNSKDLNLSEIYTVIEIYDEDIVGDDEFIGRALGKCSIRYKDQPYTPPQLKWIDIYRSGEAGGQLLGSFELLQIGDLDPADTYPKRLPVRKQGNSKFNIYPVPEVIKPTLSRYRLAVLFWGLRGLKKVKLLSVDKPRVDIECGGQTLSSMTIKNCKQNSNFPKPLKYLDIELPDQEFYCPPINITVVDCCSFGRSTLVGTHVINSVGKLIISPTESRNTIKALGKLFTVNRSELIYVEQNISDDDIKTNGIKSDTVITIVKPSEAKSPIDEDLDWWTRYYTSKKWLPDISGTFEFSFNAASSENAPAVEESVSGTLPKGRLFVIFNRELEKVTKFENGFKRIKAFDLFRGKKKANICDEKNKIGTLKGVINLYRYPLELYENDPLTSMPKNEPVRLLVRCYLVRAYDITPKDVSGKADLYPVLKLGETKINDQANYIPNQLSPIFGRMYEFDATLPQDSRLVISLKDYDLVGSDDLVGTTVIDLEDRYYSNIRATCGLSRMYETEGINKWRDSVKPSQILIDICREVHLPVPVISAEHIKIGEMTYKLTAEEELNISSSKITQEHLALSLLNQWKKVYGYSLVPEHVETRTLFDPKYPGISQGKLEMWIDIFPKDRQVPVPIDIKPRIPKGYELRVIIWNTSDVILDDTNLVTGEKMSDIFVKGWLADVKKSQSTDIHYRSLTGEGNFNWRFVFPFDYLNCEECILTRKKNSLFALDETEIKTSPDFTMQIWDADSFSGDDFLGSIVFNLNAIPRGAQSSKTCSLEMFKENNPKVSLFRQKRLRGWWPVFSRDLQGEMTLTGKIDAEFQLFTKEEAERSPVGLGRKEPDPLESPNRPETSFLWFSSPFKAMKHIVWARNKGLLIKILIFVFIVYFLILFIYSLPGYTVKRIIGA